MTIADLMQQIEETERLIAVYRNANEVIVGTQDEVYSRRGLINRTTLTAAEIGDLIVRILERRLVAMRAELRNSAPNGVSGQIALRATPGRGRAGDKERGHNRSIALQRRTSPIALGGW